MTIVLLAGCGLPPIKQEVQGCWRNEKQGVTIIINTNMEAPSFTWIEDRKKRKPHADILELDYVYSDGSGTTRMRTDVVCAGHHTIACFQLFLKARTYSRDGIMHMDLAAWKDGWNGEKVQQITLVRVSDSIQTLQTTPCSEEE